MSDPHTRPGVVMNGSGMDTAVWAFGPRQVLPYRSGPRYRNVAGPRVERDHDRRRRARHFLHAYNARCARA